MIHEEHNKMQPAFLLPCKIELVKPVFHKVLQQLFNFSAHEGQNQIQLVLDAVTICTMHRVKRCYVIKCSSSCYLQEEGEQPTQAGSGTYVLMSVYEVAGRWRKDGFCGTAKMRFPEGTQKRGLCSGCSHAPPIPTLLLLPATPQGRGRTALI